MPGKYAAYVFHVLKKHKIGAPKTMKAHKAMEPCIYIWTLENAQRFLEYLGLEWASETEIQRIWKLSFTASIQHKTSPRQKEKQMKKTKPQ